MKTLLISLGNYNARGLDSWHDHGAGLAYTASKNVCGDEISFLDMRSIEDDVDLKIKMSLYDMIGVSVKSSYWPIASKILDIAKSFGQQTIIGGYHVTACYNDLLNDSRIDYIFKGESEITLPLFLQDPSKFERTIIGEKVKDLDTLPWIDREIFNSPIEDCTGWWHGGRRKMLSVIAARGCPYQCAFCQPLENNHFGKKLRRRSVKSLIDEMLWLQQQYSPECFMIHDDTFFLQDDWLEEFVQLYPHVGLPFWASARADGIVRNPSLFRKLVNVGWELVSVGFESGSQRILDLMKKGTTVAENIEAAKIIKSAGAKVYANYMLGLPQEHKEDIQLTLKMADTINAEMPSWAYFTPYPGCELGESCIENGWSKLDKNSYDRRPDGEKVKFVDYGYLAQCLGGFRESHPPLAVDIIIPCYENEELTLNCLASVKKHTDDKIYRVILINNGSKDYSKVELMLATIPHLYLKLPTNEGFVGAVNRGLQLSTAPTICLLNNDTVVTSGWMNKLLKSLYSDPKIGIIGPLTMYHKGAGCDSQHSLTLHDSLLPKEAINWSLEKVNYTLEQAYPDRVQEINFIAFLCGLIKREVFERVGLLDTNFKIGMWDDVDYNMSAQKLGYKSMIALDTCIYHRGRSTFNVLEETADLNIEELLATNKAYLDEKHKTPTYAQGLQKKSFMRMVQIH